MRKILCIGCVTTDVIVAPVDQLPTPGTLHRIQSVSMHVGGCASNAAIDLGKMGVPATLCCKVGMDEFGDLILRQTQASGASIEGVVRDASVGTTVSIVCVQSNGERTFLYNPGSTAAQRYEDIQPEWVTAHDIIFVAGVNLLDALDGKPCARLLAEAKAQGKITVMDTAWDASGQWLKKCEDALPHLDYFMPSYIEALHISGETDIPKMADKLHALGARHVIIKHGEHGAFVREENGESYWDRGFPQEHPVDTTGAGDAFCAGFLAGLSYEMPIRHCTRLGNAVGAHCVMHVGASTGVLSLSELQTFIRNEEAKGR